MCGHSWMGSAPGVGAGWISNLLLAAEADPMECRDLEDVEVYECTGCGVIPDTGVGEESRDKARKCCPRNSLRRKQNRLEGVSARSLAEKVEALLCTYCEDVLEDEDESCSCADRMVGNHMFACPVCRVLIPIHEADSGAAVDCCLWKILDHSQRGRIKRSIDEGTGAREALERVLLETGLATESDLLIAAARG